METLGSTSHTPCGAKHSVVGACITAALLAACGGASVSPPSLNSLSRPLRIPAGATSLGAESRHLPAAAVYKLLYSLGSHSDDGQSPEARLLNVNGTLYGTTFAGGADVNASASGGTVFSITTAGTEKVLHNFGKANDGNSPLAGLINVNGTLYGTTYSGGVPVSGPYTLGTVFSITTTGTEKVLYSFADVSGNDGAYPSAGLINVNGTLYGTTSSGGTYGGGTVFGITTSGTEKVLHNFGSGTDGDYPEAGLINVNGKLYGATAYGGAYHNGSVLGGTVFSITTTGTEKVLHSFDRTDGAHPVASLINVNGTLYGTTESGGSHVSYYGCCGTVFSLKP